VREDQDPETEFAQDTSKEMFHPFFVALSSFSYYILSEQMGARQQVFSGHFDPFSSQNLS
jgi:hypothetical protein